MLEHAEAQPGITFSAATRKSPCAAQAGCCPDAAPPGERGGRGPDFTLGGSRRLGVMKSKCGQRRTGAQPSYRRAQEDWGTDSAFLQTSPDLKRSHDRPHSLNPEVTGRFCAGATREPTGGVLGSDPWTQHLERAEVLHRSQCWERVGPGRGFTGLFSLRLGTFKSLPTES